MINTVAKSKVSKVLFLPKSVNFINFFFWLFMSDAHHGINSSTQKDKSTQSSVVLTSCRHSSRRSQAVLLRNGNEAIFRLESSIAQTCKTNKQKISIYHLGRLEIFMHELRKHLVY